VTFEIAERRREGLSPDFVLRTTWSWVAVHEFRELRPTTGATPGAGTLVFGLTDHASASEDDIAILEDSRRRLDSLGTWDRADDRNCANDAPGSTSFFCLLVSSIERRMGQYHHRQPGLGVLRAVVAARWRDRIRNHPLMDFNNHPLTSIADLRTALDIAIDTARAEARR
jgi:hypothetical protein